MKRPVIHLRKDKVVVVGGGESSATSDLDQK